jgi:hypothetical protein
MSRITSRSTIGAATDGLVRSCETKSRPVDALPMVCVCVQLPVSVRQSRLLSEPLPKIVVFFPTKPPVRASSVGRSGDRTGVSLRPYKTLLARLGSLPMPSRSEAARTLLAARLDTEERESLGAEREAEQALSRIGSPSPCCTA